MPVNRAIRAFPFSGLHFRELVFRANVSVQPLRFKSFIVNTDEVVTRDKPWSESIAVGSLAFVDKVKSELGLRATHRDVVEADGTYALRERAEAYGFGFTVEN